MVRSFNWALHNDSEFKLLGAFQHSVLILHEHNIVVESLENTGIHKFGPFHLAEF